jgi:hypothetical protein
MYSYLKLLQNCSFRQWELRHYVPLFVVAVAVPDTKFSLLSSFFKSSMLMRDCVYQRLETRTYLIEEFL